MKIAKFLFFLLVSITTYSNNIDSINITLAEANTLYANEAFSKSLMLYKNIDETISSDDSLMRIAIGNKIGDIYFRTGIYDSALHYYFRSLNLAELSNSNSEIANSIYLLGNVFFRKGEMNKALEYYERSIVYFQYEGNKKTLSNIYNNLGMVYISLKDVVFAEEYFLKSIKLKQELNDWVGIAGIYCNTGIMFYNMNESDKALEYYYKGLGVMEEYPDKFTKASLLVNVCNVMLDRGNNAEAYNSAKQAYELGKSIHARYIITTALYNMAEAESAMGKYKEAYKKLYDYIQINDSVVIDELSEQMAQMRLAYETEQKEKEIKYLKELQNSENEKQSLYRNALIVGGILVLIILLMVFSRSVQKIIEKDKKLK